MKRTASDGESARARVPTPGARYKVPNLERGLRILEHLMDYPAGLSQSDLATQLGLSKSSVFRVTMTLVEYGYLLRDPETKTLRLSRKLIAMGNRTLGEDDLVASSLDIMKQLRDAVKETVLVGTIAGGEVVVLGQVLGSHHFKFSVDLGTRLPLHVSAPGKAILAFLPERERDEAVNGISFVRFNERTLRGAREFQVELERTRAAGFALDRGEQMTGIHCVAAPVFNRHGYPIAALWITGPADRLSPGSFKATGETVKSHADTISARLGHGLLLGNENSEK